MHKKAVSEKAPSDEPSINTKHASLPFDHPLPEQNPEKNIGHQNKSKKNNCNHTINKPWRIRFQIEYNGRLCPAQPNNGNLGCYLQHCKKQHRKQIDHSTPDSQRRNNTTHPCANCA